MLLRSYCRSLLLVLTFVKQMQFCPLHDMKISTHTTTYWQYVVARYVLLVRRRTVVHKFLTLVYTIRVLLDSEEYPRQESCTETQCIMHNMQKTLSIQRALILCRYTCYLAPLHSEARCASSTQLNTMRCMHRVPPRSISTAQKGLDTEIHSAGKSLLSRTAQTKQVSLK